MSDELEKQRMETKVDQYLNGELSAVEVDELWADLIQHDDHMDYLKNVANLKAIIKQRKEEERTQKYWYYSAAAAVVGLLIVMMSFVNFFTPNTETVKPLEQVELNYYRSADGTLSGGDKHELIRKAITLANTGKVGQAIDMLKAELELATKSDWIAKLSLNLGSLYYNQGDYSSAVEYYSKVISNKEYIDVLMLEKAFWYRGNAYFQQDQLTKAQQDIEKAYRLNGAYRRVTESYLKALS